MYAVGARKPLASDAQNFVCWAASQGASSLPVASGRRFVRSTALFRPTWQRTRPFCLSHCSSLRQFHERDSVKNGASARYNSALYVQHSHPQRAPHIVRECFLYPQMR